MSYEAWRISYQSSEQAARAAYDTVGEQARLLVESEQRFAAYRRLTNLAFKGSEQETLEKLAAKTVQVEQLTHERDNLQALLQARNQELALANAEIERLKTSPPEKRQDLHCVISDLCQQVRDRDEQLAEARNACADYICDAITLPDAIHGLVKGYRENNETVEKFHRQLNEQEDLFAQQLAACQLHNTQLREALQLVANRFIGWHTAAVEALALPQDTAALAALVAKAGEVMQIRAENIATHYGHRRAREAIYNLPAITVKEAQT